MKLILIALTLILILPAMAKTPMVGDDITVHTEDGTYSGNVTSCDNGLLCLSRIDHWVITQRLDIINQTRFYYGLNKTVTEQAPIVSTEMHLDKNTTRHIDVCVGIPKIISIKWNR